MAAGFGERLLAEVREEGLDELVLDLGCLRPAGHEDSHSKSRLGVRQLDDLLDVFMPVPSQQRLPSQDQSLLWDEDDSAGIPLARVNRADPVIEISSSSSAAGKSQLLYYLTAVAVLPLELGGGSAAVVFIDSDGRFDADRLRVVAKGIVQEKGRSSSGLDIEPLLTASLQHVHVFRPQSSSSLLATLQSLDTYLLDTSRHSSSERLLHAIFIDSATAFFWQDKLRDEVSRTENIGRPLAELEREREQKQAFYLADLYAELANELKRLQRRLACALIFTSIAWTGKSTTYGSLHPVDLYGPVPSVPNTPSLRPSLPAPWGTFPHLRLVVQRDAVRPFPPDMTVHDAERDAPMRHEVVVKGKFSAWVNGWGREEWPRRVAEGVERTGMFVFHVGRNAVDIVDI